ncbi:peptidoglycan-binding domain-containing protein [Psychromicrobium lacuslunae]|uniref:peptidoglycan-binding domain-containing protein n=1 Tax=Psychromicrobium lacuslunae TaxID=1618207 RepID=UPI000B1A5F8B|nr:peptidoglycan-binding protein [Psychromicrobium lacuslunae]
MPNSAKVRWQAAVVGTVLATGALLSIGPISPAVAQQAAIGDHLPATALAAEVCSVPATANDSVLLTLKRVGDSRSISSKVRLAMFETAWVESHANNLGCGDSDSVGVFQQRPSQGWGTVAQCMDVNYAANKFLDQAISNAAKNPGWTAGQVAQSVQRSAYPSRYDQAQSTANSLISRSITLDNGGPVNSFAWPVTSIGEVSTRVKVLQSMLVQRGYSLTIDGSFGAATQSAVKSFQASKGMVADGVVGVQTWPAVLINPSYGQNNKAVSALQTELKAHGYTITVDGSYGAATQNTVKSFRSNYKLPAGTTVDLSVWNILVHFH